MPVTTDAAAIAEELSQGWSEAMHVTFCTYQSLPLIAAAQKTDGAMPEFDLVICDEAHRTTGIEETSPNRKPHKKKDGTEQEGPSPFVLVHDDTRLKASRRLYMTATPRVFSDTAKRKIASVSKEQSRSFDVFTMDNEEVYGPLLYRMTFGRAVDLGCLSDYQVVVICMDETAAIGSGDAAEYKETGLSLDDAARLLGCWDALADPHTTTAEDRVTGTARPDGDGGHLTRAIAYANRISTSKKVAETLPALVNDAIEEAAYEDNGAGGMLRCDARHIDGTQRADRRAETLAWLRAGPGSAASPSCRTVVNARCLTEGVDVPALDAVIFLQQRRSQIDIIQAIGRVMRTAPGKDMGYIVLPVVIPAGADPDQYLSSSEFDKVWDVVKALRSHDERVDVWVNSVGLAGGPVTILPRGRNARKDDSDGTATIAGHAQGTLPLEGAIASKLVEKCGDRLYWPRWGQKAADISRRVAARLEALKKVDSEMGEMFADFADEMRQVVNASLTDDDLTEMLAHHIVTGPVFDSLFARSDFATTNPVSQALQMIVDEFTGRDPDIAKEIVPLTELYRSVAAAMEGTATSEARLKVLLDVYESFFKAAMPDEVQRLGIAYTPVELVDFVLASADAALKAHFGRGLTTRNVHVLDPFTGTGTFLYRLLTKPGLVADIDLERKYASEMHANEILLLPYYLASVKIEEGYRERLAAAGSDAADTAFQKIVLTDTFEMGARHALFTGDGYTGDNSRRARAQNETPIVVIVGNPPWSAGQKSAGDDNPDVSRPALKRRIQETYGRRHKEVTGRGIGKAAGNLYVQAFRWATDRLGEATSGEPQPGIVALVHPNSLANGPSIAGMRAALRDEFSDIYIVNLRGDAVKSGEEFRREGDKIFGQASRQGVQITLLVRDPAKPLDAPAEVRYAAVPEYSSLQAKFDWLAQLGDINNSRFQIVPDNESHHWENITDGTFQGLLPVCETDKDKRHTAILNHHALGLTTNCDPYVYAFDRGELADKINRLIDAYEDARARLNTGASFHSVTRNDDLENIKWTETLKRSLKRDHKLVFEESRIREVQYRPFIKKWVYEDMNIISRGIETLPMFPRLQSVSQSVSQSVRQTDRQTDRQTTASKYRAPHEQPLQPDTLLSPGDSNPPGPPLPRPRNPSRPPAAITLSGPSNMAVLGALATMVLPDLHLMGPGQSTRVIPRQKPS